jgi:hypothetical protein
LEIGEAPVPVLLCKILEIEEEPEVSAIWKSKNLGSRFLKLWKLKSIKFQFFAKMGKSKNFWFQFFFGKILEIKRRSFLENFQNQTTSSSCFHEITGNLNKVI